jgi:DNA-binding transcriptional regulator YiaG
VYPAVLRKFPLARRFSRPVVSIAPDEVRAIREVLGWTAEEMADTMAVLPLEVAAWEAGTIAPDRDQAATLRWLEIVDTHGKLASAAGVGTCAWLTSREAHYTQLLSDDVGVAARLEREIRIHQRDCPECLRWAAWLREHPFPSHPGAGRAGALLDAVLSASRPVRLAAGALALSLVAGGITLLAATGREGGEYQPSLDLFLALFVGMGSLWMVRAPTQPLADKHPFAAAHLRTAAVVLPLLLAAGLRGLVDLGNPASWFVAGGLVPLFGILIGVMAIVRTAVGPE